MPPTLRCRRPDSPQPRSRWAGRRRAPPRSRIASRSRSPGRRRGRKPRRRHATPGLRRCRACAPPARRREGCLAGCREQVTAGRCLAVEQRVPDASACGADVRHRRIIDSGHRPAPAKGLSRTTRRICRHPPQALDRGDDLDLKIRQAGLPRKATRLAVVLDPGVDQVDPGITLPPLPQPRQQTAVGTRVTLAA
jgi:hypothetical protein